LPNEQRFVATTQGDTFVVVSGPRDAVPVVLLHGSGANNAIWLRDAASWSGRLRVHAVDVIGEPGLSAPSRPPFTSDAYVQWLDEVLNGLGLVKAALVGVSLGGWIALDYVVKRPDRVACVSLVSPSGIGSQDLWFLLKVGLLTKCGARGLRRALQMVAGRTRVPDESAAFIIEVFRHFKPRMTKLPIRTDAELAALAMPVQLILGGADRMLRSHETRDRMIRLVRQLDVVVLDGHGHLLPPQGDAIAGFVHANCSLGTSAA
jgi:pimeloyl-ACP methyl ester carboxylesterase